MEPAAGARIAAPRERGLTRRAFLLASGAAALAGCESGRPGSRAAPGAAPAAVPPGEGRLAVDGGEIWYRAVGEGPGAPVVVVHGGPGFSHDYLLPLAGLGRDRPVVFYDQLDCGNSDRPGVPANWTVSRFAGEIEALRRGLGLTRFHLLGHSWGAALAADHAAGAGGRLLSCVLASPLLDSRQWEADNRRWRRLLPDATRAVLDEHEAAGRFGAEAWRDAMRVFYDRHLCRVSPWPKPLLDSLARSNFALYSAMWGETEFRATGTLRGHDGTANLPNVAAPVLFTCGEFDQAPPATLYRYARLTAAPAEVRVFGDASHMPHLEQTDAFLQALRVFFGAIG